MSEDLGLEGFLGHSTRAGGGGNYLGAWKDRPIKAGEKGPTVDTFLHTRARIKAIWQMPWPRVVERKAKDGNPEGTTLEVWSGRFNSWEHPEVLKRQYFADKDTGELENPPVLCPMARMIAAVRLAVFQGRLSWVAPLFEFTGDDPRKAKTLHAGGIYGAYRGDKLDSDQKAELKKAGIMLRDAWQESMMAQCRYIFQVVDNDAADKGLQVALEASSLGDAVKAVINDAMHPKALGPERGNPLKHPYAIQWLYLEDEQPQKRYQAKRLDTVQPSPEVLEVIVDGPPRDTSRDEAPGNIVELRLSMEKHYVGPKGALNWDEIFEPAEQALEAQGEDPKADLDAAERFEPKPAAKAAPAARTTRRDEEKHLQEREEQRAARRAGNGAVTREQANAAADEVEQAEPEQATDADGNPVDPESGEKLYACDACEKLMRESETVCSACGWEVPGAEPEPEPEPAKKTAPKRSEAKAPPRQAEPARTSRPAPKPFTPDKAEPKGQQQRRVRG